MKECLSGHRLRKVPSCREEILTKRVCRFCCGYPRGIVYPCPTKASCCRTMGLLLPRLTRPRQMARLISRVSRILTSATSFSAECTSVRGTCRSVLSCRRKECDLAAPVVSRGVVKARSRPFIARRRRPAHSGRIIARSKGNLRSCSVSMSSIIAVKVGSCRVRFLSRREIILQSRRCPVFARRLSERRFSHGVHRGPTGSRLGLGQPLPRLPTRRRGRTRPASIPTRRVRARLDVPRRGCRFIVGLTKRILQKRMSFGAFRTKTKFVPLAVRRVNSGCVTVSRCCRRGKSTVTSPSVRFTCSGSEGALRTEACRRSTLRECSRICNGSNCGRRLRRRLGLFTRR